MTKQESLNKCLHQGISHMSVEKVECWLKEGADPRAKHAEYGFTVLEHSVSKGRLGFECTKRLLETVKFDKSELTSALGYAPGAEDPFAVMELMLNKGASPDALSPCGVPVIHDCIGNGKFEEFKLLAAAGANLNASHLTYENVIEHLNDKENSFEYVMWLNEFQSKLPPKVIVPNLGDQKIESAQSPNVADSPEGFMHIGEGSNETPDLT